VACAFATKKRLCSMNTRSRYGHFFKCKGPAFLRSNQRPLAIVLHYGTILIRTNTMIYWLLTILGIIHNPPAPNSMCPPHEVAEGNPFNSDYRCESDCSELGPKYHRYGFTCSFGGGSVCATSSTYPTIATQICNPKPCVGNGCVMVQGGAGGASYENDSVEMKTAPAW
jgi:hypothetical protein